MQIETPRLIIRQFTPQDLEALSRLLSDSDVMRFSLSGTFSKAQTEQFLLTCIQAYHEIRFGQYALVLKESNQVIGFCGFFTQVLNDKEEVELAFRLTKDFWGQGLAPEAAIACRDYAFSELPIDRLISIIDPNNTQAIRVAQKAGLKFKRKTTFNDIPVLLYSIDKDSLIPN